jgi:isocitrate dehydrogenase kinase/phosphatase
VKPEIIVAILACGALIGWSVCSWIPVYRGRESMLSSTQQLASIMGLSLFMNLFVGRAPIQMDVASFLVGMVTGASVVAVYAAIALQRYRKTKFNRQAAVELKK